MYAPALPRLRALLLGAVACLVVGCGQSHTGSPEGDRQRGRELLRQYGCNACHRIPGVADAAADVGPPLGTIGGRVYLAGTLPNSAQNLARWIRNPETYKPGTAMPNLNVTDRDARDMVAYLARLR